MIQKSFLFTLLWLVLNSYASAKITQINYDATFGIFGRVGTLKNRVTQNTRRYMIDTRINVTGLAKHIMGVHTERHISKGRMRNGLMVPDTYTSTKQHKKTVTIKEYRIDHKRKKVTKRVKKIKNGKVIKDKKEILSYYAKNDLLTLYFNMNAAIKVKGKKYMFKAVGLEKQNGKVLVTVPKRSEIASYQKDLGYSADWYAKALIYQKNFRKKKGDILLSVSKDGFIEKAVIKDVLLFGDAKIRRVR